MDGSKKTEQMNQPSIAYLDSNYRSILFRGFHFLPENTAEGWVYWLPRYILHNTSLKVYFLTNDRELYLLNGDETLHRIESEAIDSIDIFFGRTAGSFDPKNRLIQSAKLKIVYPLKSSAPESYQGHSVIIVHDDAFIKPLPDHDRGFFYCDNTKKENFFLYPAALTNLKGQLKFAKRVTRRALGGTKVVFCGTTKNESYAEECFSILKRKRIDFEYLKRVSKSDMGDLYRKTQLTLFFSRSDFNPRIFYESMACGTPCLLSKKVSIAAELEPLAFRTSTLMMNRNIRRHASYPDSLKETLCTTALGLTEERCYEHLFGYALSQRERAGNH